MVKLAQTFLNGGTNFERPLKESLEVINKSRFKKADVYLCTDGEDNVRKTFLDFIYLFANESVLESYPKFCFTRTQLEKEYLKSCVTT